MVLIKLKTSEIYKGSHINDKIFIVDGHCFCFSTNKAAQYSINGNGEHKNIYFSTSHPVYQYNPLSKSGGFGKVVGFIGCHYDNSYFDTTGYLVQNLIQCEVSSVTYDRRIAIPEIVTITPKDDIVGDSCNDNNLLASVDLSPQDTLDEWESVRRIVGIIIPNKDELIICENLIMYPAINNKSGAHIGYFGNISNNTGVFITLVQYDNHIKFQALVQKKADM